MKEEKLSKLSFFVEPKMHEDFKIRLHYDGFMNQSEFFRACFFGYLLKNEQFFQFLDSYKVDKNIQNALSRQKSIKLRKAGLKINASLGLNKDEIENIFDILEEELVEL